MRQGRPSLLSPGFKVVVLGSGSLVQVPLTVLSSCTPRVVKGEPLKEALSCQIGKMTQGCCFSLPFLATFSLWPCPHPQLPWGY